jgi:thioredoxin reductase (NADPH)
LNLLLDGDDAEPGKADDDVEALLVPPGQLRALIIAEADLGERIVRALILRRVGLIESGASGPVLIGEPQSSAVMRLQGFLRRNGYPYHVVDATTDADAAALLQQYGAAPNDVLVVCPNGSNLLTPTEEALGRCLGMLDTTTHDEVFDVAVVPRSDKSLKLCALLLTCCIFAAICSISADVSSIALDILSMLNF